MVTPRQQIGFSHSTFEAWKSLLVGDQLVTEDLTSFAIGNSIDFVSWVETHQEVLSPLC